MTVNDDLEGMWKEAVIAYFKVLSWHLSGSTEENQENLRKAGPWLRFGLDISKIEVICVTTVPTHLVNGTGLSAED